MGTIKTQENESIQIISSHFKMIQSRHFPQYFEKYTRGSNDDLCVELSEVK